MNKQLLAIVLATAAIVLPLTSEAREPEVRIQMHAPALPFFPPLPVIEVQGHSQHWNDRGSSHGYDHAPRGYGRHHYDYRDHRHHYGHHRHHWHHRGHGYHGGHVQHRGGHHW